jgi:tetratricopeptide (TPR) repeat protein
VRGLVGYGPETLSLAVNRHIRPELGQIEGRGDMPDRSHNETFDVLVMHGVLGYAIRLGIYCTAFLLALRYLGLVKSGAQRLSFWVNLSLGAALGALGPYLLQGAWTLSGVGLPAGMIAGLVVFVTLEALIGQRSAPARPPDAETALIVALLAGFIAHVVEIHFGIAIVSTRLYFWSLLALLVVVSNGWLEKPASPAGAASEEAPAQQTRRAKTAAERLLSTRLPPAGLLAGLLAVAICMPLTYGLVLNSSNHSEAMPLFVSSLWQSSAEGSSRPGTLFWLLVLTLAAAAALAAGLLPGSGGRELRRRVLQAALLGGIGSLALALVHSRLLSGVGRMRAAGHGPLDAALAGSEMFAALVWLAVLLVVALGATLGWRPGDLRSWSRRPAVLSVGGGLGLALASVWLIDTANLDPIRADTLLKQARALVAADRPEIGLRLLDKACELNQKEPMLFLHRGQAAMRAAARATTPETEASYLEAAETTLLRARELAPLDPDHSANLARFLVRQAAARDQPQERERLRQRAETEYRATLALRPSSVLFINELAPLLIQSGKLDEAQAVLDRAREIDDRYAPTLLNLARLHQTRAAAAGRTRQLSPFVDSLERAIAMYERAVLLDPKLETAKKETDKLRGVMTQLSAAMPSKDRLRELYGDEAAVHLGLGRLHLDSGRLDRALAHAQIAHELAREARMDDSRALLHEVEAALRQR